MSTALLFSIPAHGHINPTLPFVSELVAQGETIIYYALPEFQAKIEQTGAIFRAYPYWKYKELLDDDPLPTMARLMDTSEALIPILLEDLKADYFDYVMYDAIASWGKFIATNLQLPTISLSVTFVLNHLTVMELGTPKAFAKMFLDGGKVTPELLHRIHRLNKQYGLVNSNFLDVVVNSGDLNVVFTSRQFQPKSECFDDSFCFVGPSLPQHSPPSDFPMERVDAALANGSSLIYISLGTLFNDKIEFYTTCMEALGDTPYQVVMSVGKWIDTAVLNPPDNFILTDYAPQIDLLKRASLFITHGGMNSVSEGLYFGVPLLVYPQMLEQGFVAKRVADLGAGLILKDQDLGVSTLRTQALHVLRDEQYRESAKQIGHSLHRAGGYKKAAADVLNFTHNRKMIGNPS